MVRCGSNIALSVIFQKLTVMDFSCGMNVETFIRVVTTAKKGFLMSTIKRTTDCTGVGCDENIKFPQVFEQTEKCGVSHRRRKAVRGDEKQDRRVERQVQTSMERASCCMHSRTNQV